MERRACLEAIYGDLQDVAVVTIMGAVAAELQAIGHRPNFFYLQHAMGLASSLGLGVALAQPSRPVVVLDGDGSLLMNLGGLTTLARYRPRNLVHVVFDNESLLSVGGFPTATSTGSDLAAIAKAELGGAQRYLSDELATRMREDFAARVDAIEAALQVPGAIELSEDLSRAQLRYEPQRVLTLEQTPRGWTITGLE